MGLTKKKSGCIFKMSPVGDNNLRGGECVVNTVELKKALLDAGMSQRDLAEAASISKNALNRKINNYSEFTSSEISAVCLALNITDPAKKCEIFLA